jgi:chromosome segregation ATPase
MLTNDDPIAALSTDRVVEIERFLNPSLRHHRAEQDLSNVPGVLSEWTQRAWAALQLLQRYAPAGSSEAVTTLDQIRAEFNQTSAIFERIAEPLAMVRRLRDLEHERAVLHDRLVELERAHASLHEYAANLETSRAELRSALDARAQEATRLYEELRRADERQKALIASMSWRITGPLRAAGRIFR